MVAFGEEKGGHGMETNNSIFDSITNSEDEMIKIAHIKKEQACLYLRAYIIIRLLFFHEFVISDSSINLNRALRTLILEHEGNGFYDLSKLPEADFGKLIESGSIKLAARESCRGNFSDRLREIQSDKKRVDLPSEKYTNYIDGICSEENIYWWNEEQVSKMFTKKIRKKLETPFSDNINLYLRELSNRLSDKEILTYNIVKNEALKKYRETSEEYQIVRSLLRESYDYNIPEVLNLDYFKFFDSPPQLVKQQDFEINLVGEYEIGYSFNAYAFALFPADYLKIAWNSKEYVNYEQTMIQYLNSSVDFSHFLASLDNYLNLLNDMTVPLYKYKYEPTNNKSKSIPVRIREYKNGTCPAALVVDIAQKGYDMASTISDIVQNPILNGLKFVVTNVFPNMILKKFEDHIALPEIERAVIKHDRVAGFSHEGT